MNAQTAPIIFQSSETQTSLLELYTSEGCSSCPPAEVKLTRMKKSPDIWKVFVPVAFHVDYWDYLGWRDPWAMVKFSDRQRAYARQWQSDTIYTPAFVLNGREWPDWDRKESPAASDTKSGLLKISSTDTNHWQISFAPTDSSAGDFEAHAALLGGGLGSDVKAGENRGRRLNHDFVALTLIDVLLIRHDHSLQGNFTIDSLQLAAPDLALAVWITRPGELTPLQASGGWLHQNHK